MILPKTSPSSSTITIESFVSFPVKLKEELYLLNVIFGNVVLLGPSSYTSKFVNELTTNGLIVEVQ